jgi:hypothetical protein
MRIVAERAERMTNAVAAVVEVPEGDEMVYRAASAAPTSASSPPRPPGATACWDEAARGAGMSERQQAKVSVRQVPGPSSAAGDAMRPPAADRLIGSRCTCKVHQ